MLEMQWCQNDFLLESAKKSKEIPTLLSDSISSSVRLDTISKPDSPQKNLSYTLENLLRLCHHPVPQVVTPLRQLVLSGGGGGQGMTIQKHNRAMRRKNMCLLSRSVIHKLPCRFSESLTTTIYKTGPQTSFQCNSFKHPRPPLTKGY